VLIAVACKLARSLADVMHGDGASEPDKSSATIAWRDTPPGARHDEEGGIIARPRCEAFDSQKL